MSYNIFKNACPSLLLLGILLGQFCAGNADLVYHTAVSNALLEEFQRSGEGPGESRKSVKTNKPKNTYFSLLFSAAYPLPHGPASYRNQ